MLLSMPLYSILIFIDDDDDYFWYKYMRKNLKKNPSHSLKTN